MSDIHANKNINFLPLRGTMVFPHTMMHIDVARPSIASVYAAMEDDQRIFLVTQNNDEIDDPGLKICSRPVPSRASHRFYCISLAVGCGC